MMRLFGPVVQARVGTDLFVLNPLQLRKSFLCRRIARQVVRNDSLGWLPHVIKGAPEEALCSIGIPVLLHENI